jgi:hypothetical protein
MPATGGKLREIGLPAKVKKAAVAKNPVLKGWNEIAKFLGQPVFVAQRWSRSGMPITREGRRVTATEGELNQWLGRESKGEPVHIAAGESDLSADLKRGLSYVRKHH